MERLIALQDLQQLQRDLQESSYQDLGFEKLDPAVIGEEVEGLREEIDPRFLQRFDHIRKKYERPLVPVRNGVCYGCFVRFPTARLADFEGDVPLTCESCGRLLYRIP
ncbi:MAG TPA: C4-type zinc ribbon domain-containing protein [Gemmatimonadota bacterium]|nr:C4-type zinc ribbon domain-containing protein [Gemmatimonadota bacterium]